MLENYDKLVSLYIRNCRVNELSENTVASYERTFRYYRESLVSGGFTDACLEGTVSFKLSLTTSVVSTDLYLRHLSYLSDFAVTSGMYAEHFMKEDLMPPKKKVAAERHKEYEHVLTEEEIVTLATAESAVYTRTPHTFLRERAETVLFLMSGLRNSELRALTPADLDWENGIIHARVTKGDKPRYVSFGSTAQQAVAAYLKSGLRPDTAGMYEPLFGTVSKKTGEWKALERTQISDLIHNYTGSILGEDKAVRTHALRHGYSSLALENGVSMEQISESLGHASLATTKIYAQRLTKSAPAQNIAVTLDTIIKRKAG